jgi:SAM-dependent methyltransferase
MSLTTTVGRLKECLAHPALFDAYQAMIGVPRCHARLIAETLQVQSGERVLDIGCGVGASLRHVPDGARYVGIDVSEAYIRQARRRYKLRGEFICLDLAKVDGDQLGTFDRVFAFGVLHHLPDDLAQRVIELVGQVLRPGGRFMTIDPCYVQGQSRIAKWFIDNDRGRHVRDVNDFKAVLSKLGEIEIRVCHDLYRIPFTHLVCRFDKPSAQADFELPD